jgi:hypothetical protein
MSEMIHRKTTETAASLTRTPLTEAQPNQKACMLPRRKRCTMHSIRSIHCGIPNQPICKVRPLVPSSDLSLFKNNIFLGKCQGLTITPFSAGHSLGGAIWKIRSPSAGTILYAVDMNHMRERHLDGTVLMRQAAGGVFEPLARPDLLITDADRASVVTSRRRDRDAALIGTLKKLSQNTCLTNVIVRHYNRNPFVPVIPSPTL